jgi:hypothetical protein
MKNIKFLLIALICGSSITTYSQDESDGGSQKVRVGIVLNSGASWLKLEKDQENNGLGFTIGGGLVTEFRMSDYVSFVTGVSMVNLSSKVKYSSDVNFIYESSEDGITMPADTSLLLSRGYFFKTVQIPLRLKLKTPEIGYLTYFAEVGVVGNVIYESYTKKNTILEEGTTKELLGDLTKIDAEKVTNWFRGSLSMNLGFEYSLVGNTALVVSLTWDYALTNVLRDDDLSNTRLSFANTGKVFSQKGNLNYAGLKVALMF